MSRLPYFSPIREDSHTFLQFEKISILFSNQRICAYFSPIREDFNTFLHSEKMPIHFSYQRRCPYFSPIREDVNTFLQLQTQKMFIHFSNQRKYIWVLFSNQRSLPSFILQWQKIFKTILLFKYDKYMHIYYVLCWIKRTV